MSAQQRRRARTGLASSEFFDKKRLGPCIGLLRQCWHPRAAAAARESVIGIVVVDRDQRIVHQRSADLGLGLGWREFVARRDMQQQWLAEVLPLAQQIVETDAVAADHGIAVGARYVEELIALTGDYRVARAAFAEAATARQDRHTAAEDAATRG